MTHPPEILLDRRSGRSSDEFGLEDDLTFQERVALFEQAEYSLGFAETARDRGYQKSEVYGETREIEDALVIFGESAEFHASRIDEKEIAWALESETIDPAIAEAIRERQKKARSNSLNSSAAKDLLDRYPEHSLARRQSGSERDDDDSWEQS